jgi:hypothetical protein
MSMKANSPCQLGLLDNSGCGNKSKMHKNYERLVFQYHCMSHVLCQVFGTPYVRGSKCLSYDASGNALSR